MCGYSWGVLKKRPQCPECKSIDIEHELDEKIAEKIWTRFRCTECSSIWDGEVSSFSPKCPDCGSFYVADVFGYMWLSGNLLLDDLI